VSESVIEKGKLPKSCLIEGEGFGGFDFGKNCRQRRSKILPREISRHLEINLIICTDYQILPQAM
jgi:hypothetical protein